MPRTDWGWLVTPDELRSWIIAETDQLLIVNKPAHVLCHPSKQGPWSSLVGACRELLGVDRLHLVSRLDRETSGVITLAKDAQTASLLQQAIGAGGLRKTYIAILNGNLKESIRIDAPVGLDIHAEFKSRQWIVPEGRQAITEFTPLYAGTNFTIAAAFPLTGRRHQIRVHAAAMGHFVLGDKLYGPDPDLMLRFISEGFSLALAEILRIDRHALHAWRIDLDEVMPGANFCAPLTSDLVEFSSRDLGLNLADLLLTLPDLVPPKQARGGISGLTAQDPFSGNN